MAGLAVPNEVSGDVISDNHARQIHVRDVLLEQIRPSSRITRLLNLGCGDGRIYTLIQEAEILYIR